MGVKESNLLKEIQLHAAATKWGTYFRNQTGSGYQGTGKPLRIPKNGSYYLEKGDLVLKCPRLIQFGLVKGGGDLIGWKNLLITPEMVGRVIAQFSSREGKTENAQITPEQINFHNHLNKCGGDSKIIYTLEEAFE